MRALVWFVWVAVGIAFGLASQLPIRVTSPVWQLHIPKGAAQALSSYLLVAGLTGTAVAALILLRKPSVSLVVASVVGLAAVLLTAMYLQQIRAPSDALDAALGAGWHETIPAEREDKMLSGRWRWALPGGGEPRWERDVVYAELDGGRRLLADVWQPPTGVEPSGLALVYVHGGYYAMLDKDSGTRPLFRHLARQGHVIVDLSYRLVDETDIVGMVADVKRGIAWIKDNAEPHGVDPDRIVVGGASSGGNLALLAAYTADHPALTPDELSGDTTVRAAVAYYGVHDFPTFSRLPGDEDLTRRLFGGSYHEVPDRYALGSPVHHVSSDTPATLLVQGLHDQQHLIDAGRNLARTLESAGVRVANVELPATDHAFDLILGRISAPGIAATYELERFLAVIAYGPP